MEKDKSLLLSIGQLSKMTNVSITSLRYYDKLGILRPAYVDPQSGYRYYNFSQGYMVFAVQQCVALGIPLSRFESFIQNDYQILFSKVIETGRSVSEQKIKEIENNLKQLESLQALIDHAEKCISSQGPYDCIIEEKTYWLTEFKGRMGRPEFSKAFTRTYDELTRHRQKKASDFGVLQIEQNHVLREYLYIELDTMFRSPPAGAPVITLPAAKYRCVVQLESNIEDAPQFFPELFQMDYEKIIFSTELFTGRYNFQTPMYELRCLIPENA